MTILDSFGKTVRSYPEVYQSPGEHQFVFHGENFVPGVYFYKMMIGEEIKFGKMILLR